MSILQKIKDKDIGFKIDEVMTGHHQFEKGAGPKGRHKMEFAITWGPEQILEWVNPLNSKFLKQPLEGTVTIGGLCHKAKCKGIFELKYFKDQSIKYSFDFKVGKKAYQYVGEKVNIKPWNLLVSHTTCFGRMTEKNTGKLISTSVLHFKLITIPKFLASFRLV